MTSSQEFLRLGPRGWRGYRGGQLFGYAGALFCQKGFDLLGAWHDGKLSGLIEGHRVSGGAMRADLRRLS